MATTHDAHRLRDLTRDLVLAGRKWRKLARQTASRHGVSEAGAAPLVWVERLGENVRQNALAEAVGIEGASLVRLLDELETAGLVTRTPDPADRRANSIRLTDEGRRVVQEVDEDLEQLRRQVFADISAEEVTAAARIFEAIRLAVSAEGTGVAD